MLTIGVAGGSGSGKTTVVKEIVNSLPKNSVSVIYLDSYYKDNEHLSPEEKQKINFDHPSSFEFNLLIINYQKTPYTYEGKEILKEGYLIVENV